MKETMLQEVMTQPGQIAFREIPIPRPQKGQVVVKIKRIGVCGSDIHVYYGKHSGTGYPVTQGHEVSGCICAVGEDVTGLSVGQKVTIEPQVVCGKCYPCRHGKYNLCENLKVMGFQTTGAASEYFAVDAAKITPLPDSMSYNEGAMIEPLAVTVHAAKHFDGLQGAKVAVLGCGPIGILLAQSCKAMGAAQVMITGATMMMIVSKYGFFDLTGYETLLKVDASRIASQIVSGIGFLGAGMIFVRGRSVTGLTTAAGIWATAGIGMAIGAGMYPLGLVGTALVLLTQYWLHKEGAFGIPDACAVIIRMDENKGAISDVMQVLKGMGAQVIEMSSAHKKNGLVKLDMRIKLKPGVEEVALVSTLEKAPFIVEVENG